jgi:hypothetical protein
VIAGRKLAATLLAAGSIVTASAIGLTSSASAASQPTRALSAAQTRTAVKAAPALSCGYGHICGQGANGNRFDYLKCNTVYQLPNLVGNGPLNNNQTPGTVANFFDHNGGFLFSSTAPEQREVNWTPVWFVRAC